MSTIRRHEEVVGGPGSLLFGRTRGRVLAWLLGHPDESFYLREIVRRTDAAHGAVQRELDLLTGAGLLQRTVRGRQVYFQANREAPIFPELQRLLLKTIGIWDVLRESLAPLGDQINVALVFGSAARGELRQDSDIDLLVVGAVTFAAVAHAVSAAQDRLGRDVNPTVYRPEEFRAKVRGGHHFLTSILAAPHILVIGRSDVIDGLAEERVVDNASDERARNARPVRSRRTRPGRQRHGSP